MAQKAKSESESRSNEAAFGGFCWYEDTTLVNKSSLEKSDGRRAQPMRAEERAARQPEQGAEQRRAVLIRQCAACTSS